MNLSQNTLPAIGLCRWKQIKEVLPISREKWRQMVVAGTAPQPIKFGTRCTMYRCDEIHNFINNISSLTTQEK